MHRSIFEVIRIPVVGKYPGLGYGGCQRIAIRQPVDYLAPTLLVFPCSWRLGAQAVNRDDATEIRLAYSVVQVDILDDSVVRVVAIWDDLAKSDGSVVDGGSLYRVLS